MSVAWTGGCVQEMPKTQADKAIDGASMVCCQGCSLWVKPEANGSCRWCGKVARVQA